MPTTTATTPKKTSWPPGTERSEEHTSELQSRQYLVCRLLLEKKKKIRGVMLRNGTSCSFSNPSAQMPRTKPKLLKFTSVRTRTSRIHHVCMISTGTTSSQDAR